MNRTANVSALGYAAFALTLWMNNMIPAGWFNPDEGGGIALALAVVLGGCVMAIAGVVQCLRGRTLDAVVFLAFSAYWWVAVLASQHLLNETPFRPSPGFLGWYYIVWAFLAFCIWLAACKDGVARMLFTLGLTVSLLAFALNGWTRIGALAELGGYLGLVTAVVGIYLAAAEIINEIHGHSVLPLGETPPDEKSGGF
ncbi:MAG TPA: acetate uptake transporter [Rhodanobacteraceae bacterium]|nr:acetate uptake transporter [Rhodanobacteraceae bacterium]